MTCYECRDEMGKPTAEVKRGDRFANYACGGRAPVFTDRGRLLLNPAGAVCGPCLERIRNQFPVWSAADSASGK